jgi:hypothetical protein
MMLAHTMSQATVPTAGAYEEAAISRRSSAATE